MGKERHNRVRRLALQCAERGLISEDGSDPFRWSFRWVQEKLGKGHVYFRTQELPRNHHYRKPAPTMRSILRRAWQLLTAQKYDKLHKSEDNMFHNCEGTQYIDVG